MVPDLSVPSAPEVLGKGQMGFQMFFLLIFTELDGLDTSWIENWNVTKMNEDYRDAVEKGSQQPLGQIVPGA